MMEDAANLKNHYILCGAGQTGLHIAQEFTKCGSRLAIIDLNPGVLEGLRAKVGEDPVYIAGDATEDETLERAGIRRAKGFIAALSDDQENLFAVLTARSLNPRLRIVARVDDEENTEKLRHAGANVITAPNQVGGMRMASEMIRPEVVKFLDQMLEASEQEKKLRLIELSIADIGLAPGPDSAQLTIADVGQQAGLLVIAIKRDGEYIYRPRGAMALQGQTATRPADVLVVIATQEQLNQALGPKD